MYREHKIYPQDFRWKTIYKTEKYPMGDIAANEAVALHQAGYIIQIDPTTHCWEAELEGNSLKKITNLVLNYLEADGRDLDCMSMAKIDEAVFEMTVSDLVEDAVNIEGMRQFDEIASYVVDEFDTLDDVD